MEYLVCCHWRKPQFITSLIKNKSKYYRVFSISKGRGKKKRIIEAPKVSIKIIQSWVAHHLSINHSLGISENAYAFIPGRMGYMKLQVNIVVQNGFLSIDLRDFFHTITSDIVISTLVEIGYRAD
ncbi:hypothetical protein ACVXHA_27590 [Escherichia coli]